MIVAVRISSNTTVSGERHGASGYISAAHLGSTQPSSPTP
jgi:hypothetical protein